MNNKKWIILNISIFMCCLLVIGSFNFFMDPFWTFEHNHKYNSIQKGINERQQKANHIFFTSKEYDTLLLGSSRTTYLNRHSFSGMNVFNFSTAAMRPQEYKTYIDFVMNDTQQDIDTIILAVDFFGYLDYGLFKFNKAQTIIENTKSELYRWKILFGFNTLNNSFKNIRDYFKGRIDDRYDRDLVKTRVVRTNHNSMKSQILRDVEVYSSSEYSGKPYSSFEVILSEIQQDYKDKKIIIYTTPISQPLFEEMIKKGHYQNYQNWLKTLVKVFREVHHFMYPNEISKNYSMFFADSNHAYPKTYDMIAQTITSNYKKKSYDFGLRLTEDNINSFFNKLDMEITK